MPARPDDLPSVDLCDIGLIPDRAGWGIDFLRHKIIKDPIDDDDCRASYWHQAGYDLIRMAIGRQDRPYSHLSIDGKDLMTMSSYTDELIKFSEDFNIEFNHQQYIVGMPYTCWHCGKDFKPQAEDHPCIREMQGGEEVLANPYTTVLCEDMYKIASRNESYDYIKAMLMYAEPDNDPLMAVCMSVIFNTHHEMRRGWLEHVPTLDPQVKEEIINFRL